MVNEVPRRRREAKRHPGQVPKREHVAEPVGGDVHRGEDGLLVPQRVHLYVSE